MKKLIIALASFFMLSTVSFALQTDVWISSNTATADTTKNICAGIPYVVNGSTFTSGSRGVFHGVCINNPTAGTLTVYNSSATATSPIAAINTSSAAVCSFFDVATSSGLTYTNSATANITLLYQCY